MNAKYLPIAALFTYLFLSSCAAAATPAPAPGPSTTGAGSHSVSATIEPPNQGAYSNAASPRLVIKNAALDITVENPDEALQSITAMAEEMGGFVVNSSLVKTRNDSGIDVPQGRITIRVPAQRLNDALSNIHALVKNGETDVSNETITGEDVTEDYVDLNSRLSNLEATEKQLQQIMETTSKTEDVLSVFRELTNIRQEIEVIKGKIKFYEGSASLSAIDVNITGKVSVAPVQMSGWQPVGVARDALQALIEAGKFLVNLAIWLGIFILPVGLLIYFPAKFIRKQLKRIPRKSKPASEEMH